MMQNKDADRDREPRVTADEGWKRTVAEEKAKLRREDEARHAGGARAPRAGPVPQPSIETFMAGLYTQTLIALGEVENPLTGKKETQTGEAAYLIDIIAMLQSKTQGNLTAEENSYVQRLLTDLRMRYVRAAEAPGPAKDEPQSSGQPG